MAKINLFLSFSLFVLIAMTDSSSSRMIRKEDHEVVDTCPKFNCVQVVCPIKMCPEIRCSNGVYTPCCDCPRCCPPFV
ncbi:hypothetical protein MKW94_004992 [Papaver nudicaule]|uniref:Uncharacterized protein n=1 Tax=Papaver nudicaule TaxID=74823 RepID=A0AA41VWV5_PAPNU|nr:hypothetical protein [Papaver nudicaule]